VALTVKLATLEAVLVTTLPPVLAMVFVYLALAGWGHVVAVLARVRQSPRIGILAGWGMAATVTIGGVLNLSGSISPALLRAYTVVGAAIVVWREWRRRSFGGFVVRQIRRLRADPLLAVVVLFSALAFLATLAGSALLSINPHDDAHAYLVFPRKMLDAGSLGADPFSERRMLAYGGQSFLQAIMLAYVDVTSVHAMDRGLACLVAASLIVGHAAKRRVSVGATLAVLWVFGLMLPDVANVSAEVTGMALLLALMSTFVLFRSETLGTRVLLMATLTAAIIALKNSLIIAVVLTFAFLYVVGARATIRARAVEAMLVAAFALLLLAPWMVDMRRSSGTLLYPLLGHGYHASAYSKFPPVACGNLTLTNTMSVVRQAAALPSMLVIGALIVFLFSKPSRGIPDRGATLGAFAAAFLTAVLLSVTSGFEPGQHYDYPLTAAMVVFVLTESLGRYSTGPTREGSFSSARRAALFALLILLPMSFLPAFHLYKSAAARVVTKKVRRRPDLMESPRELRTLQSVIPRGESVLARLARPYNLDFARNRVFIIDWPCGAGPAPGIPCSGTAEDVARYLRSRGVRFVMYSYANEAKYSRLVFGSRLTLLGDGYSRRVRRLTKYTFAFQDRLSVLGRAYERIGDDGKVFVLDLLSRQPGA